MQNIIKKNLNILKLQIYIYQIHEFVQFHFTNKIKKQKVNDEELSETSEFLPSSKKKVRLKNVDTRIIK